MGNLRARLQSAVAEEQALGIGRAVQLLPADYSLIHTNIGWRVDRWDELAGCWRAGGYYRSPDVALLSAVRKPLNEYGVVPSNLVEEIDKARQKFEEAAAAVNAIAVELQRLGT